MDDLFAISLIARMDRRDRRAYMIELRERGLTYENIGRLFHISRQCVQQTIRRSPIEFCLHCGEKLVGTKTKYCTVHCRDAQMQAAKQAKKQGTP